MIENGNIRVKMADNFCFVVLTAKLTLFKNLQFCLREVFV